MNILQWKIGDRTFFPPEVDDRLDYDFALRESMKITSSAISGPLLVKLFSLFMETFVLNVPSSVRASTLTASSSSVFWKMM